MPSFLSRCLGLPAGYYSTLLAGGTISWLAAAAFLSPQVAWGQAGNAIAVGVAVQDMTQGAANQSTQNIEGSAPPSTSSSTGSPAGPGAVATGPMSPSAQGSPSGSPGGYPGSSSGSPDSSSGYPGSSSGYPGSSDMRPSDGSYGSPDGSYGAGYGAPSQGPGLAAGLQMMTAMFSSQIAASAAEMFADSGKPKELDPAKLSLWQQAALAFYTGDQNRALSLYYAHIIADGPAADEARKNVAFSRDLRRPLWQVRFGISTHVRLPDGFAGGPEPIRDGMKLTGVPGRRNGSGGGGYSGDTSSPSSPESGDPRMADSREGAANMSPDTFSDPSGTSGYGTTAQPRVVEIKFGGAAAVETQQKIDESLGFVATVFGEMFDQRQTTGKFGHAFDGMKDAGEKLLKQSAGFSEPPLSALPMWAPGIDYVGDGPYASMLGIAKSNRLDYLLHFEVAVKENRLGSSAYLTRCKLMSVETGDTLGLSKAIDKYEVVDAKVGIKAAIEAQLANLFEIIDKRVVVEPLPALQPQQAVARIDSLLATNRFGMLRNLAEIKTFHSRQLLTDQQLNQCVFYLTGDRGLQAMHDMEAVRYESVLELVNGDLLPPKK